MKEKTNNCQNCTHCARGRAAIDNGHIDILFQSNSNVKVVACRAGHTITEREFQQGCDDWMPTLGRWLIAKFMSP